MSFQMIHMEIAYRVAETLGIKDGKSSFILGSVLPDSVHMRDDYSVDQKIRSHLFEGCGPWGAPEDYDKWRSNIRKFWKDHGASAANAEERITAAGVVVHCITDYWNDIDIWNGTKDQFVPPEDPGRFKEDFYREARAVDQWLHQNSVNTNEIMSLLEATPEKDMFGFYTAEDISRMKDNLLRVQYDVPRADISGFKYYTGDKLESFLESVTLKTSKALSEVMCYL